MKASLLIACGALALAALPASAQNLKPGLWEMTNRVSGSPEMNQAMADAQKAMASMPPEQRKMMEEMMAKQGVRMAAPAAGGAMKTQVCLSQAMVERNTFAQQQGDCRTTSQSRSGNTLKMAFTCTNPPTTGESEVVFQGSEAYTMKMNMTQKLQGRTERTSMEGSGRFLGSNCGNLKPLDAVAPARK